MGEYSLIQGNQLLAIGQEVCEVSVARLTIIGIGEEAEGVTTVAAVGRPFLELLGIERCLCTDHGGTEQTRGFTRDRITALGISEVVVKGQPQTAACTGAATAGTDAILVDVPLGGLALHKLQRTRGIVEGPLDRRLHACVDRLLNEAILHGHDRDARIEHLLQIRHLALRACHPATAMNEKHQRRGRGGVHLVEVQLLIGIGAVSHIDERGFDSWCSRLGGSLGLFSSLGEHGTGDKSEDGEESERALHGGEGRRFAPPVSSVKSRFTQNVDCEP